jgi:glutathione S-transferase
LYESRAIARYLATLGSGPELIPTEPKARAKFEQAASIEHSQFDPIACGILLERVFKQYWGATADEERVSELILQLESKLDGYEAILSKQKYLASDVCGFVPSVQNDGLTTLRRRSPSQIYSTCRMVSFSLMTSVW